MLTTIRRLALPVLVFLAWTPAAYAWSWPVQGPVLQPFAYDEAHPYAPGQLRGIDIGAEAVGDTVVAPAAGTVSFAGTVPTNGKSVTIATADGYSITLTHLGSVLVAKGAVVAEQDAIGTIGPSGTPELAGPYVHLGIRHTADPDGYLDPLEFLPPIAEGGGTESDPAASQPGAGGSSSAPPGNPPSASSTPVATSGSLPATNGTENRGTSTKRASTGSDVRSRRSSHARQRAQEPRTEARSTRSPRRPVARPEAIGRSAHPVARPVRADGRSAGSGRRPVVETTAPVEPSSLDAGHETRPSASVVPLSPSWRRAPGVPLALILNGVAAGIALAAALMTARGRRRRGASPAAAAQVLHLPRPEATRPPASHAA